MTLYSAQQDKYGTQDILDVYIMIVQECRK